MILHYNKLFFVFGPLNFVLSTFLTIAVAIAENSCGRNPATFYCGCGENSHRILRLRLRRDIPEPIAIAKAQFSEIYGCDSAATDFSLREQPCAPQIEVINSTEELGQINLIEEIRETSSGSA